MMNKFPRRSFVTSDGVQLSYIRQGNGRPIVLVHGWSQCAEEFKYQTLQACGMFQTAAIRRRALTSES